MFCIVYHFLDNVFRDLRRIGQLSDRLHAINIVIRDYVRVVGLKRKMGVMCQMLVNKKPGNVHKPGQAVTGIVKYAFDKKTEYKRITLSLLGTGKCTWTVRRNKQSRTYYGSEDYVTILIDLLKTPDALEIGAYEYPFEFLLPENLPSSFNDDVCTIAYKIQLKFEKVNFFSFNKVFSTEIPVQGYIEPTQEGPVVFGLEKNLIRLFSNKKHVLNLKTEITKTFVIPGENVYLTSVVTNDTSVAPLVRAEILCFIKYTANCGKTKTSYNKIKDTCSDIIEVPALGEANISQTVSTDPSLYSITSKIMLKEYRVRVTIRLPLPHVNAIVEMPVLVGERNGMALEECADDLEKKEESTSSVSTEGDAPPSYWEVMAEDEEMSDKT